MSHVTTTDSSTSGASPAPANAHRSRKRLLVTVSGGGPAGLAFALKIQSLMRGQVTVEIFDRRWEKNKGKTTWVTRQGGNERRQQVVTIQSRQYLKFPQEVQDALFQKGKFTEMWPRVVSEPAPPRNLRIAHIEDELLRLADDDPDILLRAERFDPATVTIRDQHVLVIAEGSKSTTREYYIDRFGNPDDSAFSMNGVHLQDTVLGLLVKSNMSDAAAVTTTVAQNRFLLNTLGGEGFLNMRLTPEEVEEVKGYNPVTDKLEDCIHPCMMLREKDGFRCPTHGTLFKPALDGDHKDPNRRTSPLWSRVLDGLKLFDVPESQLLGITAFRLSMVQRPRFTAELLAPMKNTPGTFGCLIGDAANAIHFWPGRGLNSGFASAFSLAHCLAAQWRGSLRDADFMLHEAAMSMIQYRNTSRAWRAMTATDEAGQTKAIQNIIGEVYSEKKSVDRDYLVDEFASVLRVQRDRLKPRLEGLPTDNDINRIAARIQPATREALITSGPWDTSRMAGDEVDLTLLFDLEEKKARHLAPLDQPLSQVAASGANGDESKTPRSSRRLLSFIAGLVVASAVEAIWPGTVQSIHANVTNLFSAR